MADQFSRFSDLPPELRVAIWILSLPPPFLLAERSLSITNRDEPMRILKTNPISNFFTPSKRSVPSVLHVCRESRSEFLAMGKTQTESQMVKRNGHRVYSYFLLDKNKGAVFFAAGCDVLLLTMDCTFSILAPHHINTSHSIQYPQTLLTLSIFPPPPSCSHHRQYAFLC